MKYGQPTFRQMWPSRRKGDNQPLCRDCGAEITWVRTFKNDKAMPLDKAPSDKGNVIVRPIDGKAIVIRQQDRLDAIAAGEELYVCHFATCPARRAA